MNKNIIKELTKNFEDYVHKENNIEFWFARDLQILLGYSKWDNFVNVIDKAKESCKTTGNNVSNHFADASKTIPLPKEAQREIQDIKRMVSQNEILP